MIERGGWTKDHVRDGVRLLSRVDESPLCLAAINGDVNDLLRRAIWLKRNRICV